VLSICGIWLLQNAPPSLPKLESALGIVTGHRHKNQPHVSASDSWVLLNGNSLPAERQDRRRHVQIFCFLRFLLQRLVKRDAAQLSQQTLAHTFFAVIGDGMRDFVPMTTANPFSVLVTGSSPV